MFTSTLTLAGAFIGVPSSLLGGASHSAFWGLAALLSAFAPAGEIGATDPSLKLDIAVVANFLLIAGLIKYGFTLFAEYHERGKWAKNVTGLLAGIGMLVLALAMIMRPRNAQVIALVAQTKASVVFLWISSALMLAAIAAFGLITFWKPLRLLHERHIGRSLRSDLPKLP